jgi:hypothetical protein
MTGPTVPIDKFAESAKGFVTEWGAILLEANDQINKGTFGAEQWAKSTQRLSNLALTAGIELAPPLLPIPCLPTPSQGPDFSDFITTTPDNESKRELSVARSFVRDGAPWCVIPDQFVVFQPGILPVYARRFRLAATWPGLRSGTYRGRVRLTRIQTAKTQVDEMDVIVDL